MRVNVAVKSGLAETDGHRVTPTLVMFLDGGEIRRIEGPLSPRAARSTTIVTRPFAGASRAR